MRKDLVGNTIDRMELKIKILRTTQHTLRILKNIFPSRGLNNENTIERAYWAVVHSHDELARRKRNARRLMRMGTKGE
jgi:hypothetical protein